MVVDTKIFDTDILIWVQRGNKKAAQLIDKSPKRLISTQTYLELLQEAQGKSQHQWVLNFLSNYDFEILPPTEGIGHRACIYIEEYTLSSGLRAGDAIVAATAAEHNTTLVTSNNKHFKAIHDLKINIFKP